MPQSRRPPPSSSSPSSSSSSPSSAPKRDKTSANRKRNTSTSASTSTSSTSTSVQSDPRTVNPLVLSQFKSILNTFRLSFSHLFTPELPQIIQSVKHSLYLRDYVAAFDSPQKLQAYVVRWSVARALAYFDMISGGWWSEHVTHIFTSTTAATPPNNLSITCVGGGAGAEIVGIAAAYSFLNSSSSPSSSPQRLDLTLLDFATWAPITDSLYTTLITDSSRDPTKPDIFLDKSRFSAKCHQQDVLTPLSDTTISSMASADIVTILFTAGELYSQSPTATTKFLMSLHALTKPGALLVVVDSAGGFEDLDVLNKKKNSSKNNDNTQTNSNPTDGAIGGYKLGFLLDKTLTNREQWQTVVSHDAKWWRVPQQLKDIGGYPLELENMRCLIRVYRRNSDP
ncbi:hypothetical protein TWF718_008579 [Orbilia javanica]|uniref:Uncharacterized protein n=1 Tax=Orbilia javanica TaxID=47235 RepID=A0AAN8RAZ6_9PEZI